MLLNKSVADGEGKRSRLKAVVSSLNPANLFKSKKSAETKLIEEKFGVLLPENTVVDARYHEAGLVTTAVTAKAQQEIQEPKLETPKKIKNDNQKDIHREDIQKLEESRIKSEVTAKLAEVLLVGTAEQNVLIENELIPAFIEDFRNISGLGPDSLSAVNQKLSNRTALENVSYAVSVINKMIDDANKPSFERPIQQWNVTRDRGSNVSKQGKSDQALKKYEQIRDLLLQERIELETQVKKQKFLNSFTPEVRKIIVDHLLSDVISEDFSEVELFAMENNEIKYHLYQALVELNKEHAIPENHYKIELAFFALVNSFKPDKKPFGQQ